MGEAGLEAADATVSPTNELSNPSEVAGAESGAVDADLPRDVLALARQLAALSPDQRQAITGLSAPKALSPPPKGAITT